MTSGQGILSHRRWTRGKGAALLLVAAVAAGTLLRLAAQTPEARTSGDSFQYILLGRALAAGQGFASGGSEHPDLSRPPLLPLLLAGAMPLTGGDGEAAGRLVAALCGGLLVVPLFFLARGTYGGRAALAAVLLGGASCAVGAGVKILPTAPYVLVVMAGAALAWAGARRGHVPLLAAAGVMGGLAALTRGEGIVWPLLLAAWTGLQPPRGRRPGRLARALLILAGATAVYLPYATWAAARLGRLSLSPPIEYLAVMRDVTDRTGLRWAPGPDIPWQARVVALPSADHRVLVLPELFSRGRRVEPDPTLVALEKISVAPGEAPDPVLVLQRRLNIVSRNAVAVLRVAKWHHFLTPLPLVLAGVGLLWGLGSRRRRPGALFVAALAAGGLAPVLSHVEGRFLYPLHALGLVWAAGGWAWIGWRLAAWRGRRGTFPRLALHGLIAAALLLAGRDHVAGMARDPAILEAQEKAARAAAAAPPGALLGVRPDLAYLAGRPFRMLPVGPPQAVRTFAAAQEATLLALEGREDAALRPHLQDLIAGTPPSGFTLLHSAPDPRGGRLRIYQVERHTDAPGAVPAAPAPLSATAPRIPLTRNPFSPAGRP